MQVDPAVKPPVKRTCYTWRLALLVGGILTTLIIAGIGHRNQQQWNRVRTFERSIAGTESEAHIAVKLGTDFCRFGRIKPSDSWPNFLKWPTVNFVRISPRSSLEKIDWTLLDRLETEYLVVNHPEFSDAHLAAIPDNAPLIVLRPASPKITNASVAKIQRFPKLFEVTSRRTSIDSAGLLQLARETALRLDARLTPDDLTALRELNAVQRIVDFDIDSHGDFQVSQCEGVMKGAGGIFRGRYNATAFQDAHKFLDRQLIEFERAELDIKCLTDIAQMKIGQLYFNNCQFVGSFESDSTAESTAQYLELSLTNTHLTPSQLRVFGGRKLEIFYAGEGADDAWLDAVMQVPEVVAVHLKETRVTDEAVAKYALDYTKVRDDVYPLYAEKVSSE